MPKIWLHGEGDLAAPRLDKALEGLTGEDLSAHERGAVGQADRALCIYTSGTTGMPKAANVSHHRIMMWSHWFMGLADIGPQDRMYDCLPLYHSVGGDRRAGRGAGGGRLGGDPGALFGAPVLGRHAALGLHAVPVYRRTLPLSDGGARRIRPSGRIGCALPAATA